jgi:hypothetical protein
MNNKRKKKERGRTSSSLLSCILPRAPLTGVHQRAGSNIERVCRVPEPEFTSTQGIQLARQALYHLVYMPRPFVFIWILRYGLMNFAWAGIEFITLPLPLEELRL